MTRWPARPIGRTFPQIEEAMGWPHRRIASVHDVQPTRELEDGTAKTTFISGDAEALPSAR